MLMNLLSVCNYLLIALILLPGSNPRSLNADQSRRKNETTEDGAKLLASLNEFNNFVDGQCPPSSNILNVNGLNGKCKYECINDVDCTEDYKCCEYGCSFVCMEPWFPNRVVDWAKSSSLNQITDNPELSNQNNGLWKSRAPCSTSVLDGLQPLRCPTNYVCQITMDGDEQLNIPNRGECVGTNQQKLATEVTENDNHHELSLDTECLHQGEKYKHKEKFRRDCNICVCHNGVVFCDNRPCARAIGIPAAVSNYKDHKQTSKYQYISIDSDNDDTESASGSGNDQLREKRNKKSLKEVENFVLTDDEDTKVSSDDSDGDSVQRREVGSGDDHQAHGHEVDSRDNEEVNSGDGEQGNSDNGETFLGSGSAETEKPKITDSTTTTEIYTQEIFTLTKETSTLAPETSTLAAKTSTIAPQTSTSASKTTTFELETKILAPKASTSPPGIDERETTEYTKVVKNRPTVDIVILKGSDYETSGLDDYSGDDGEYSGSSGDDGSSDRDEGSTEEIIELEQAYPDTITLAKYNPTANLSAVFGFETDEEKIDVVHDGSPHRNYNESEENSGNEETASGGIEDRKHGRKYERNSKTSEYFQTTDDEQ